MKRLALVGASVRAAAESAMRAGLEPIAADLFADTDLRAIAACEPIGDYPSGFEAWLAKQQVDAWAYTGGLENHPELVSRMEQLAPLWGNGADVLRAVRNPFWLKQAVLPLATERIHYPETVPTDHPATRSGRWLCKPAASTSGLGIEWLGETLDPPNDQTYAQRFIEGRPLSALYRIDPEGGAAWLGLTHQLVGQPGNPWQWIGGLVLTQPSLAQQQRAERLGRWLTELDLGAHRLAGPIGVDLVETAAGDWYLTEINPRYTAAMEIVERSTGQLAFSPNSQQATEESWGKRVVFAREASRAGERFAAWAVEERAAGRLADIPQPGTLFEPGDPVATCLVPLPPSASSDKAISLLETACGQLLGALERLA